MREQQTKRKGKREARSNQYFDGFRHRLRRLYVARITPKGPAQSFVLNIRMVFRCDQHLGKTNNATMSETMLDHMCPECLVVCFPNVFGIDPLTFGLSRVL